jgi:hypothetical protein
VLSSVGKRPLPRADHSSKGVLPSVHLIRLRNLPCVRRPRKRSYMFYTAHLLCLPIYCFSWLCLWWTRKRGLISERYGVDCLSTSSVFSYLLLHTVSKFTCSHIQCRDAATLWTLLHKLKARIWISQYASLCAGRNLVRGVSLKVEPAKIVCRSSRERS